MSPNESITLQASQGVPHLSDVAAVKPNSLARHCARNTISETLTPQQQPLDRHGMTRSPLATAIART